MFGSYGGHDGAAVEHGDLHRAGENVEKCSGERAANCPADSISGNVTIMRRRTFAE
jgi:hypothetical protein